MASPFTGGICIHTEVTSDFDIGQTPVGRDLGNRFSSSGRLTYELILDDEATKLSQLSEVVNLSSSQDYISFVDALSRCPNLNEKYFRRNGVDGLVINLDGCYGFLSFRPTTPNSVPKPKQHLFSSKGRKYKFKTSISLDEVCSHLLGRDEDVLACVNLCRVDYKLGSTYRCHKSGKLEIVEGTGPSHRGQKLRKVTSNMIDPAMTLLGVAGEATSVFPPASAAIKSVLAIRKLKKTCEDHRDEAQNTLNRVNALSQNVEGLMHDAHWKRRESIEHGAKAIIATCSNIRRILQPILKSSLLSRLSKLDRNRDTLQEVKRLLEAAERDFMHLKDSYLITLVDRFEQTLEVNTAEVQRLSRYSIYLSVACF